MSAMEVHHRLQGSLYDLHIISGGVSGLILGLTDSTVVKVACGTDQSKKELAIESTIYDRLNSHPYITKFHYTYKGMIVLERLQYPLRKRLWDLHAAGKSSPAEDVLRWALQISLALQHLHSHNVFQVDIGTHNILLDWFEDAKLSDFAGSSIDGSKPSVVPVPQSKHPKISCMQPSTQSEMFALGSTLYEIETTQQPYHGKDDREVEELYTAGRFPHTGGLIVGEVINKCWRAEYEEAREVVNDIMRISVNSNQTTLKPYGLLCRLTKATSLPHAQSVSTTEKA